MRKRLFDILFSTLVLLLSLPLLLAIALIIRLTSKGPALYFQERIGRDGKPFHCWKLRTMYIDAEARLTTLLLDEGLRKEWETSRKLKNDPRIAPFGRFLRSSSMDELPQFWNVLKGDLSVVGPRPVVKEELQFYYGTKASKILSIRPGITGLWQVFGRSNTSYKRRVLLDEKYVETFSFTLDLKLILFTIATIFSRKGAY
jgi:exopolysaccharide production protein ExoY